MLASIDRVSRPLQARVAGLLSLLLAAVCASCTSASGDVKGGDLRPGFDAAAPPPLEVPITEPTFDDAAEASWRGLYRDFFGRGAQAASCAGRGTCHGTATEAGARQSGFVCGNVEECWQSLRQSTSPAGSGDTRPLVAESDVAKPGGARLFEVLRSRATDGTLLGKGMPAGSDYAYTPDAIDRMQLWIAAGAKND